MPVVDTVKKNYICKSTTVRMKCVTIYEYMRLFFQTAIWYLWRTFDGNGNDVLGHSALL